MPLIAYAVVVVGLVW